MIDINNFEATENSAGLYGGFGDFHSPNENLKNGNIRGNIANYGGALHFETDTTASTLNNIDFENNKATSAGGAVFWNVEHSKTDLGCIGCTYSNNLADYYGNDFATDPSSLSLIGDFERSIDVLIPTKIPVKLIDYYNQTVSITPTIAFVDVSISQIDPNTKVKLITEARIFNHGLATLSIQLIGDMSEYYVLTLSSESHIKTLNLTVELDDCDEGQMSVPLDGEFYGCQDCPVDFYNLNKDQKCYPCPAGAKCLGKNQIVSEKGYYLVVDNSTSEVDVLNCPPRFCDANNKCGENRHGFMCSRCIHNYAEWGGRCSYCPDSNAPLIIGTYLLIWVLLLALYYIPSVNSSITKILANYIQVIQIVVFPTSSWALEGYSLLNIRFSNVSFCYGPLSYYNRFLLDIFVPVLCVVNVTLLCAGIELYCYVKSKILGLKVPNR